MVSVKNFFFFIYLIYFISSNSDAYRILVVSPFNSKSHNNMLESVAKALALKGHRVDMISHFELKNPPKNYTTIINLDGTMPKFVNNWTIDYVDLIRSLNLVYMMTHIFGNNYCKLLSLEKMQNLIKNPPNDPSYDLVITEASVRNCYFGIGYILKLPMVVVSSIREYTWYDPISGNPMSNAFAVNLETMDSRIMTFWDRVKNHFWAHYHNYEFFEYTEESQTADMRKYLSSDIPSIREVEKKISLILVNTYHSSFGIRPLSPVNVQIGGIQIEQNEAKLTPELKIWMDESTHGIVYFTLGSMVLIEDLSKEVLLGIYASFAKLAPMRVLMKIVNKEKLPPDLPDNVLTMPWIPQIPVLGHKNTKIFMTHGGLNSVLEAIYHAVPMVGISLFADQPFNIRTLFHKNVVYEVHYKHISEKSLDKALNAVLHDPKYREATKRESRLFRDRPMSATDTAVYWVEYIIRNGENSLRSPAMDMPWWKAELLDIYGFSLLCTLLISYIAFLILRKIAFLLFGITNPIPKM